MDVGTNDRITFYFDPSCPWTWVTSRFLIKVREQGLIGGIDWAPFSLALLNPGKSPDDAHRKGAELSEHALRAVASLHAEQSDVANRQAEDFYTGLGNHLHRDGEPASPDLLCNVAAEEGIDVSLFDDESLDELVASNWKRAFDLAGPGIGSPVLERDGSAIFGPVLMSIPTDSEEIAGVWQAVSQALSWPNLRELKRGRQGPPDISG